MKNVIKLLSVSCIIPLLSGCMNLTAEQTTMDEVSKQVLTNKFHVTAVFQKSAIEKLEIAAKTKTTSKLVGIKNTEVSGDIEMVNAIANLAGTVAAATAKAAVKE